MSLYAQIKTIQHIPSSKSSIHSSYTNQFSSYIICYQQITKPNEIYQTTDLTNWKDATIYYQLKQDSSTTNAEITYGNLKVNSDKNTQKLFPKKNNYNNTPFKDLVQQPNTINYYPLPLYSESSELSIKIYQITKQENPKEIIKKIENKTYQELPIQNFCISRKQIKQKLGLEIKSSITSSSNTIQTQQNYQIIPKPQENKNIFECTIKTKLPNNNHIEISFIFTYDNLRQCTGYLRAAYANSYTNQIHRQNHQVLNNSMQSHVSHSKINTNLRHIFNYSKNQAPVQRVEPARVPHEIQTRAIPQKSSSFFNFFCCKQQVHQDQNEVSVFNSQRKPDTENVVNVANVQKGQGTPKKNKPIKNETTPKTTDNSSNKSYQGIINLTETDFYKGSCKTKNLFSMFDEKKNGQTTNFIEPYLGHNEKKI